MIGIKYLMLMNLFQGDQGFSGHKIVKKNQAQSEEERRNNNMLDTHRIIIENVFGWIW